MDAPPSPAPPPQAAEPAAYFLAACERVLRKVLNHADAYFFRSPVDPVADGLPTYHEVVTQPMDLGTVKTRLRVPGHYAAASEVLFDCRLTFANALLFNAGNVAVCEATARVQHAFEASWAAEGMPSLATPSKPRAPEPLAKSKSKAKSSKRGREGSEEGAKPVKRPNCSACSAAHRGNCGTELADYRCLRRSGPASAPAEPYSASLLTAELQRSARPPRPPPLSAVAQAQLGYEGARAELAAAEQAALAEEERLLGWLPQDARPQRDAPPEWAAAAVSLLPDALALADFWLKLPSGNALVDYLNY